MAFQYQSASHYERSRKNICRTFKTTVEPTVEPITLENLKDRLRIGSTCDFDAELSLILTTARKQVEADTYRRLVTQTVIGYMDAFEWVREIELRLAPISSITSIVYVDLNGVTTTYAASRYTARMPALGATALTTADALAECQDWTQPSRIKIKPNGQFHEIVQLDYKPGERLERAPPTTGWRPSYDDDIIPF